MRSTSQSKADRKPKQNIAGDLNYTVGDFNREFPNDDACLEYIKEQRWTNGVTRCEKCNIERKHYRVTGRTAYACDHCGNHIYPLAGTVFAKSTTSLKTWFYAIYLIASTGCTISAKQIQRETGVTYKTAWRALQQIRGVLANEALQLERPTAEDEMRRGNHCRPVSRQDDKAPVVGRIERSNPGRIGRYFDI
jgi:transposase